MSSPDWGDVPTWIAAIAASAAFVGAMMAYRTQAKSLVVQRDQFKDQKEANEKQAREIQASVERLKDEQKRQRRAQAKQVAITIDRGELMAGLPKGVRRSASSSWIHVGATVRNTSPLPIHRLRIQWHGADPYEDPFQAKEASDTLLPGEKLLFVATIEGPIDESNELLIDPNLVSAVVLFRDADGVEWRVGPNGKVDEIVEDEDDLSLH